MVHKLPSKADFREICRDAGNVETIITVRDDYRCYEWLHLGSIMFRKASETHRGIWELGAYLLNATDSEHDAAWLLKMELVGVNLISVEYGRTTFSGWIHSDNPESFRVPLIDYNPIVLETSRMCGGTLKEQCRRNEPHVVVPDEFYMPPHSLELFDLVRGRYIEISTGVIFR